MSGVHFGWNWWKVEIYFNRSNTLSSKLIYVFLKNIILEYLVLQPEKTSWARLCDRLRLIYIRIRIRIECVRGTTGATIEVIYIIRLLSAPGQLIIWNERYKIQKYAFMRIIDCYRTSNINRTATIAVPTPHRVKFDTIQNQTAIRWISIIRHPPFFMGSGGSKPMRFRERWSRSWNIVELVNKKSSKTQCDVTIFLYRTVISFTRLNWLL